MNRRIRSFLLLFSGAAALTLLVILLFRLAPDSPVHYITNAREKISEAGTKNADKYSPALYREAVTLFDSAMKVWNDENSGFFYSRNFERVRLFAEMSADKASEAIIYSEINRADLKRRLEYRIDTLNFLRRTIDRLFDDYPLNTAIRNNISRGEILLRETEIEFNAGEYVRADLKAVESKKLLLGSYNAAMETLNEYFRDFPQWERWVKKTIGDSRRDKNYAVVVDKFARKCYLYNKGVMKHRFNIELGVNWVGDKRLQGDKATPEGLYRITKKIDRPETRYHKALLIDYPNQDDKERFRRAVSSGSLPKSAQIGGLIEIHGNGGRGTDWTDGCIALTNAEMDIIYNLLKVGTPVVIVGSTVSLEEMVGEY
jgi:hypothetical protein